MIEEQEQVPVEEGDDSGSDAPEEAPVGEPSEGGDGGDGGDGGSEGGEG